MLPKKNKEGYFTFLQPRRGMEVEGYRRKT